MAWMIIAGSPVGRVGDDVAGQFGLPAVAVRQQLLLVVEKLLTGLGGELEVRSLHDRVDRAGLLAEAAIDALGHVDVVASRAAAAVRARLGLDGDGLGRTDRLTQLAGDAALLAVGIAAEGMLAAEARAERPLLIGVVDGDLRPEHVAEGKPQAGNQLLQQKRARAAIDERHGLDSPVEMPSGPEP